MSGTFPNVDKIFQIESAHQFNAMALEIFQFQAENNEVYKEYLQHIHVDLLNIDSIEKIPFLPISFFKTKKVISGSLPVEKIFKSSGTTDSRRSQHYVTDLKNYESSFIKAFEQFYGSLKDICIIALLPSYMEQGNSSLIYMTEKLIALSNHPLGGFMLNAKEELNQRLQTLKAAGKKTILLGVSYALLDFIEYSPVNFPELIVMETGGMKGRRKELTKAELHTVLCKGFGVSSIHSEYGMTELLSQAYSTGEGIFKTPPWMKVLLRPVDDPLSIQVNKKTGGINIVDLANVNSCSFIATQDLGRLHSSGQFEILGRFDHSDTRGCNLLVQ